MRRLRIRDQSNVTLIPSWRRPVRPRPPHRRNSLTWRRQEFAHHVEKIVPRLHDLPGCAPDGARRSSRFGVAPQLPRNSSRAAGHEWRGSAPCRLRPQPSIGHLCIPCSKRSRRAASKARPHRWRRWRQRRRCCRSVPWHCSSMVTCDRSMKSKRRPPNSPSRIIANSCLRWTKIADRPLHAPPQARFARAWPYRRRGVALRCNGETPREKPAEIRAPARCRRVTARQNWTNSLPDKVVGVLPLPAIRVSLGGGRRKKISMSGPHIRPVPPNSWENVR